KHYAAGDRRQFQALLTRFIGLGALLGIAMILAALLAGRALLTFFYRAEYADSVAVFVWVAIAWAVGNIASALGYAMTAARFFFIQAPLFVLVALVTAVACGWLVPAHQLAGAAWAIVIGQVVQMVGSAAVVAYALRR